MLTSKRLSLGDIYTRRQLAEMFNITDATIRNGIFKPKGHDSIWLFVTRDKPAYMAPYRDDLQGDTLYMAGQTAGLTDRKLIDHERDGREVILFYREAPDSYPPKGFRYEGQFVYMKHEGAKPAQFVFRRADPLAQQAKTDIAAAQVEESGEEGATSTVLVNKYERDAALRAAAVRIHGTACQACGFSFSEVYGERGDGFIEVHHLRSLASYGGPIVVNPRTDLAVVCANCHRMIHRKPNQPLSIEELKKLLGKPATASIA